MKAQISNLIDGGKVKRMMEHPKYTGYKLHNGQFIDTAGTNHIDRAEIAEKVKNENENLVIELLGHRYELQRQASCSGKTIWWSCEISEEDFFELTEHGGIVETYEKKYTLTISQDMFCTITSYARKNANCQWKDRTYTKIDTAYITIL
jgi:hypothetical protein